MSLISFIGCGNMGTGMLAALCKNKAVTPSDICITEKNPDRLAEIATKFGCFPATSNEEAVRRSKYIMLCVKPQVLPEVLSDMMPAIKDCLKKGEEKVLVSIAAGTPIEKIRSITGMDCEALPIVRLLPNLPAAIGQGLIFFATGQDNALPAAAELESLFCEAGMTVRIPESQMDAAGVMGGCIPAFAYMFIEAMADGAVMSGMARADAIAYAAQAVKGAASLVLEGTKHPEQLKDEVCSPAGTTIAGVKALEEHGFRNAAFEAVISAYEKSVALSKK